MIGANFIKIKYFGVLIVLALTLFSCNKKKTSPGYIYFPDMTYSRAYETYSENPIYKDNMTLRTPAEGTIPRGYKPFPYEKTEEDLILAGKELFSPYEATEENLERGELVYQRNCKQCHGEIGDGQGHLYTSKRYPYPPASLINDKMKAKPLGEMFHQVTVGWGIMGAQGPILRPEDRWKVVLYVRHELQE